ncbi:MAG: SRPBCC family protein [Pseudomonadota bacterium]
MTAVVAVVHDYPVSTDRLWDVVTDYDALAKIMRGWARFRGLPEGRVQAGQGVDAAVSLFGLLPARPWRMEIQHLDPEARRLRSREAGLGARAWIHEIAVDPCPAGARLTDRVTVDAGWRTPVYAVFARAMLRGRHGPRCKALGLMDRPNKTADA